MVDNAKEPGENASAYEFKLALDNRSRDNKDVAGKEAFSGDAVPFGFARRGKVGHMNTRVEPVRIHHKFVLIDAKYTGAHSLHGLGKLQ